MTHKNVLQMSYKKKTHVKKFKCNEIWQFVIQMHVCDTARPRDAHASKNKTLHCQEAVLCHLGIDCFIIMSLFFSREKNISAG